MSAFAQTLKGWFSSQFAAANSVVLPVRLGGRGPFSAHNASVQVKGFDQPLVWVTVTLLLWGLVMVYSASIAMPDNPRFANYAHTHFLMRHILSISVAIVAALLAFQVPLQTWEKVAPYLFVASLLLLVAVLVPFIGIKLIDLVITGLGLV